MLFQFSLLVESFIALGAQKGQVPMVRHGLIPVHDDPVFLAQMGHDEFDVGAFSLAIQTAVKRQFSLDFLSGFRLHRRRRRRIGVEYDVRRHEGVFRVGDLRLRGRRRYLFPLFCRFTVSIITASLARFASVGRICRCVVRRNTLMMIMMIEWTMCVPSG